MRASFVSANSYGLTHEAVYPFVIRGQGETPNRDAMTPRGTTLIRPCQVPEVFATPYAWDGRCPYSAESQPGTDPWG